jgi:hypothetical protein
MKPKYYEFYHIEGRRDIQISEEKLKGKDLIDIL